MERSNRPPLSRLNQVVIIKDKDYLMKKETERRRQVRVQQARQRANDLSRVIRQRVQREQFRMVKKIGEAELEKYRQEKLQQLHKLQSEYQSALKDLGLGHEGAKEQFKYEEWKASEVKKHNEIAVIRGHHAMKVVNHQKSIDKRLEIEKANLRKSIKMSEEARAAKIRAESNKGQIQSDLFAPVEVIEVDLEQNDDSRHVRFADENPMSRNYTVRSLKKGNKSHAKTGIEEAIREELDKRSDYHNQRRIARTRGVAVLKRAQMTRQRITESFFNDSDIDKEGSKPPQEEPEPDFDEVDLIPTKEASTDSTDSSTASFQANVIRLDPGQESPVSKSVTSDIKIKGLVLGHAMPLQTKTTQSRHLKSKLKEDEDFIAKVLAGIEMGQFEDDVAVSLQLEEVSTFQLSSSTSVSMSASSTTQSLSSTGTLSSQSLAQERFLSQSWTNQDIHGLISAMKTQEKQSDNKLRFYIERLLSMKREEISNLSVTTTDHSTSIGDSTSKYESSRESPIFSSTPASILTSSSERNSSSGSGKSVRFQDQMDGSFQPLSRGMEDNFVDQKKKDIMEQTQISLQQIQSYYDEQRRRIEFELDKRRKAERPSKENESPVSEGPLSSSTHSSRSSSRREVLSSMESPDTNDQLDRTKPKMVRKTSHFRLSQQQLLKNLNKSSSSGTTTSGSIATAELLQRLQRLEMPSLQRPPPRRDLLGPSGLTDDLNTSADLKKAPELDSSSSGGNGNPRPANFPPSVATESSFRFSTDLGTETIEDTSVTNWALSTSSSG